MHFEDRMAISSLLNPSTQVCLTSNSSLSRSVSHDTYFVTWPCTWQATEILLDKWSLNGHGEGSRKLRKEIPGRRWRGMGFTPFIHVLIPPIIQWPVASMFVVEIKLSYILSLIFEPSGFLCGAWGYGIEHLLKAQSWGYDCAVLDPMVCGRGTLRYCVPSPRDQDR